ncbi:MAG: hypothetical protein IPG43_10350 [Proteobacteria bacterium]|nr:hypothetical protein [Pseudomonadota bacterium]
MTAKAKVTRFRAYQLGNPGSSFSYFDGSDFTLIEARLTDTNKLTVSDELRLCGLATISTLHITSWDQDHCVPSQLAQIIENLKPRRIEYPGYDPKTDSGKQCLKIIEDHKRLKSITATSVVRITPDYINSLDKAKDYGYRDVLYHPRSIDPDSSNNNSTSKQFRTGSFNVLSLGDVSSQIASGLRTYRSVKHEVDIMILAHHGAANGFTTSAFIKHPKPTIAIATADYQNQFEHPKQEIRDLLYKNDVRLFTTKTGDVVAFSTGTHVGHYRIVNLKAGSTEISSSYDFQSKKLSFLSQFLDNIRAKVSRSNKGPKG